MTTWILIIRIKSLKNSLKTGWGNWGSEANVNRYQSQTWGTRKRLLALKRSLQKGIHRFRWKSQREGQWLIKIIVFTRMHLNRCILESKFVLDEAKSNFAFSAILVFAMSL